MKDDMDLHLHHVMDKKDKRNQLDQTAQGVISTPLDRPEGPLKVSGRAPYADEEHPDGTAHGVFVRSTIAHGWVTGMNTAALRKMPGVLAVIRDRRLLRNPAQGTAGKSPVQNPNEITSAINTFSKLIERGEAFICKIWTIEIAFPNKLSKNA